MPFFFSGYGKAQATDILKQKYSNEEIKSKTIGLEESRHTARLLQWWGKSSEGWRSSELPTRGRVVWEVSVLT